MDADRTLDDAMIAAFMWHKGVTKVSKVVRDMEAKMFKLRLINFDATKGPYWTFADAVTEAKRIHFEAVITEEGVAVASWSPIYGLRVY